MPQNTSRGYTYPLYTDLTDFPAQDQDLATDLDTDITNVMNSITSAYNRPACKVQAVGVNQNVPVGVDTTATFTTEVYDNAAMFDIGVSNTTITFPESAIYVFTARCTFAPNTNVMVNGRQIHIATTGSLGVIGRKSILGHQNVATTVQISGFFWTSVGSTATMVMRQNSGAATNSSTRMFSVARISQL